MKTKRTNPDFLNGVPELLILQLLARRPRYGYELVQAIHVSSGATFDFGEGCVYPLLHRLEDDGFLASERIKVGGRDRFVYRVTKSGKARLASTRSAWEVIVAGITRVLHGGSDEQPAVA